MDAEASEKDYERMLVNDTFRRDQLKRFASTLAEVEARQGWAPRTVLINGIKRDDLYRAVYRVHDLDEVRGLLEGFLTAEEFGPDILINGVPAQFLDVQVTMDLR